EEREKQGEPKRNDTPQRWQVNPSERFSFWGQSPPSSEASDHHIFERPNIGAKKGGGQTNAVSLTGLGEWLFSQASSRRK
ncbi:hypothetical protein KUA00_18255, partial [Proteus mirabilis]|uniref:hypothetical protein n=1 Tax=Proteus mirabilis TaxID=584 RepID=UPI0021821455